MNKQSTLRDALKAFQEASPELAFLLKRWQADKRAEGPRKVA